MKCLIISQIAKMLVNDNKIEEYCGPKSMLSVFCNNYQWEKCNFVLQPRQKGKNIPKRKLLQFSWDRWSITKY